MATLEQIQAKMKKLQAQADALVAKKSSAVIEKIRELMEEHGLSRADIEAHTGNAKRGPKPGFKRAGKSAAAAPAKKAAASQAKGKLPPKYLNPKTGETWSGHARPPAWIKDVKDRRKFLIAGGVEHTTQHTSKAARTGNYVRGPQPAMYRNPKTGAEWSGRGRAPAWIAKVKDRARFLIAGGTEATVAATAGTANKAKTAVKKPSAPVGATAHKGQRKGPQPALYRDPKSGATWSGRGPAPAWLAGAKDRTSFLIDGAGAVATEATTVSKVSKPKTVGKSDAVAKRAAAKKVKPQEATTFKEGVPTRKGVASRSAASKSNAPASKKVSATAGKPAVGTKSGNVQQVAPPESAMADASA